MEMTNTINKLHVIQTRVAKITPNGYGTFLIKKLIGERVKYNPLSNITSDILIKFVTLIFLAI